jgi:hypothetical protein
MCQLSTNIILPATQQGRLLPTAVFTLLTALAFNYVLIVGAPPESVQQYLTARCAPGGDLVIPYTGIARLDKIVCPLTSFFVTVLEDEPSWTITLEVLSSLPVIPAVMMLESGRAGRSVLLSASASLFYGILCQQFTGAVVFSLYWLFFVLSGQATRVAPIDSVHGEAVIFSTTVGYILPSIIVFVLQPTAAYPSAIWLGFALWQFLLLEVYPWITIRRAGVSGRRTAQALYAITFLTSAIPHIGLLLSHGPSSLLDILTPRSLIPGVPVTVTEGSRNFLAWDFMYLSIAAAAMTLWFARSARECFVIALWHLVGSAIVGPGAALSALLIWREGWINPS